MKKLIILSCVTAVIVSLAIFEIAYFGKFYADIEQSLMRATEFVEVSDMDGAEQILSVVQEHWDDNELVIYLFSNHNSAAELNMNIISAMSYVRSGEQADALAYLKLATEQARSSVSSLHLYIYNIF